MSSRVGRFVALLVVAFVCACGASSGRTADDRDLSAYMGLGTWVDLYDHQVLAKPEAEVAKMAKRGVVTLYLETSNYQMRSDVVNPTRVARFIEAAHANGMQIVAWYLPSFRDLARDKRRSLAAIDFTTPGGERFDSFALDIESSVVKPAAARSARLVSLSRRLRAAEPDLTLGAIVPAPRGMQRLPWYWPGFPFVELARTYDVFLPMGYFTYRSKLPSFTGVYTQLNITLLRTWTGNPALPVHPIGGIADAASTAQVRAFARAARSGKSLGASMYDFATTTAGQWRELRAANDLPLSSTSG
jgi:hypothetical protein